jgi:phosphoglycolate phosphatase
MSPIKTIIFDLDGTLIDSSKSILAGFASAFHEEGITPTRPLSPEIIGPPLKQTLAILAGDTDPALIDRLADRFKHHYDGEGYKETTVFEGIDEMLSTLQKRAIPLAIATNKRLLPTRKIIRHLGWEHYFLELFALDSWTPPAANKAAMIGRALGALGLEHQHTLYVGDRREDGEAAGANRMPFALAEWGYGEIEAGLPAEWHRFARPSDFIAVINNGKAH